MTINNTIKALEDFIKYYSQGDVIPADVNTLKCAVDYLQDYRDLVNENGGCE